MSVTHMPATRLALAALAVAIAAGPSAAIGDTKHDSNAPLDFSAQNIELQDKQNRALLSGNVEVRQAEMTLRAARVTIAYIGSVIDGSPEASRLDAAGNVVVTRPDERASSDYAIYDVKKRQIVMLGNVTLTQPNNSLNGGRVTIDLDSGHATIDGRAVGNGQGGVTNNTGGRVTGRFLVPTRDDSKGSDSSGSNQKPQ